MIEEWAYLVKKYTISGARERFEEICTSLYKRKLGEGNANSVRVSAGDGGIDIFSGELGKSPVIVFQCKFFHNGIEASQKQQIQKSFRTVMMSKDYSCSGWTLCMPEELSLVEHLWWSDWKQKQQEEFGLEEGFIQLADGGDLIDDLKRYGLYEEVFDEDLRMKVDELLQLARPREFDLDTELALASDFIGGLKNYFSGNSGSHLERKQTGQILDWVAQDRKGLDNLEKVLVIKGKKGVGKSTVIGDVYRELLRTGKYCVLAVKCDQYYDINSTDLAKQLFNDRIGFEDIFASAAATGKKLVVLLDQLDALSQTLSTDRRWLLTYMTLIDRLISQRNVRVILSARSFDLDYDADLIRFSDQNKVRQLEVDILSIEEVTSVLKILGITIKNNVLFELLRVPYNIELFTKITDIAILLEKDASISVSRLHSELYSQVLKDRKLKVTECLDKVVGRMYNSQPNLVEERYLEKFGPEIGYLISQGILVRYGVKLSFFHQSFYENYLARWFVESEKDLVTYIFDKRQNLYIRSIVKTVVEYLREADHLRYIELYQDIIASEKIRYHIRYLFIISLAQIEEPTDREKEIVYRMLESNDGKLFFEVFSSPGWLLFFMENKFLPNDIKKLNPIFHRNISFHTGSIFNFIRVSELDDKESLISNLLPIVHEWTLELLPYFESNFPYSEQNELWYFEILKKIALVDMNFVLERLRPVILTHRKSDERMKFDYRYDRVMEYLFKIDPKSTAEFLFGIQLEILEATKHPYYGAFEDIVSPLLGSRHYDNGTYHRDSSEEKSIESFLVRYYGSCPIKELQTLFLQHKDTDYVPLLILLVKLLRDRFEELVDEIFLLLKTISDKSGLKGTDDFFQLNIRKLIAKSLGLFNAQQYEDVKGIMLSITHPYEIYLYSDAAGKRKHSLTLGKKKYLFLQALPREALDADHELRMEFLVLKRRYGYIDPNQAMDGNGMSWRGVGSPLSNPKFEKFDHTAWLSSMRKINEGYKHKEFSRGGILEHCRCFEAEVEKRPGYFYGFINSLFEEEGVSPKYISHGISALIKAKDDIEKTGELIKKEVELPLDREYTQYAIWHSRFLIDNKMVTPEVVGFWTKVAKWEPHENDCLNPGQEISDFINTPRGTAVYNLMHLDNYSEFAETVFETIEYIIREGQEPTKMLSCGIMSNIAYLNRLNIERAFTVFKRLVLLKDSEILKHSINPAQYYNNSYHARMGFYFDEMLKHEELYKDCYFFISSWLFKDIDDYAMYDNFMELGGDTLQCAMEVAEKFLVADEGINERCIQVLERCLSQGDQDLSREFSGLVLREFKTEHFLQLYGLIAQYVTTAHFAKDPRYLFEYLTECAAIHPCQCLELLCKMDLPFDLDIRETAYLGDEPLVLVLAVYSKLWNEPFIYGDEREKALDEFDRMLTIPSIRNKAFEAMESVLN
jgi:hypothetical protein